MVIYSDTNVGKKRENNEDYMLTCSLSPYANIYMVLDGIGGANSGEIASSLAATKIEEYMREHFEMEQSNLENIKMAVKYGNRCVYEKNKQDKVYKDMGTTISLLYEENNMGYIISIGDSRLYEVKDNNIEQLTEDDTYVNALVRDKIITREEAAIHPEKHVLLKAIGVTRTINFDVKELGNIQKRKFLLCTDGLTNMVSDNKILEVINSNKDSKENICKNLIEIANINGGKDNITVIYIEI